METDVIISKTLTLVNSILSKDIDERNNFPIGFTYYQVLERAKCSLDSLQLLVSDSIVKHDHAIGLILRNLLSDFITTGFIIRLSKDEETHYVNLYSLHNSDLKKVDALLNMYKNQGYVNADDLKSYEARYSNDNHIYKVIRDYCEEHQVKSFLPTRQIISKFLESDKNDIWVDKIKQSYGLWSFLSKYEHLGWNSYDLTRGVKEKDADERLRSVLFNTLIMIGCCFEILKEQEALKKSLDLMKDFS